MFEIRIMRVPATYHKGPTVHVDLYYSDKRISGIFTHATKHNVTRARASLRAEARHYREFPHWLEPVWKE